MPAERDGQDAPDTAPPAQPPATSLDELLGEVLPPFRREGGDDPNSRPVEIGPDGPRARHVDPPFAAAAGSAGVEVLASGHSATDEAAEDEPDLGAPPVWLRSLQLALFAAPVLVLAVQAWRSRWMADDGLIDIRIIDQFASGHGPVFNRGERVEASTSPLWIWIMTAVKKLLGWTGASTERLAVFAGIGLSLLGLAAAEAGAARLARLQGRRGILLPVGAAVIVALPGFWEFATSGLETGLSFGWLGLSLWALARQRARFAEDGELSPMRPWWGPVLMGLGPLVRPDLALFSVAFLVAWLICSEAWWRPRAGAVILALVLPGLYQVFRMGYYGAVLPNTAMTKEAGQAWWDQGWVYVSDLFDPYHWWVPVVAIALVALPPVLDGLARGPAGGPARGWRSPDHRSPDWRSFATRAAPCVGGVLSLLYVARVGGDFMHARMLMPAVFGAAMPFAMLPVGRGRIWATCVQAAGVAVMAWWAFSAATAWRPWYYPDSADFTHGIVDERAFWIAESHNPHPVEIDDFSETVLYKLGAWGRQRRAAGEDVLVMTRELFATAPTEPGSGPVVESGNLGILGLSAGLDVRVADTLGLADPIGSRLERGGDHKRPGHEKELPEPYVYARWATPRDSDSDATKALRKAMKCGDLRKVMDAAQAPMSPTRFIKNLIQAPQNTAVRIPLEAGDAVKKFCG